MDAMHYKIALVASSKTWRLPRTREIVPRTDGFHLASYLTRQESRQQIRWYSHGTKIHGNHQKERGPFQGLLVEETLCAPPILIGFYGSHPIRKRIPKRNLTLGPHKLDLGNMNPKYGGHGEQGGVGL